MLSTQQETIAGPQGTQLYLETYGNPQAEQTLLLVHGGLQSLRCFEQQFAPLSEQAYVIALDLPYHGQSAVVPSFVQPSPALWAQGVRAVLEQCQRLDKPLMILAWSFGGLVTRHYLLTYGQQGVNGLILVGSLFGALSDHQRFLSPLTAQVLATMGTPQVLLSERIRAFELFVGMLTKYPLPPDARDAQYGYNSRAFLHSLGVSDQWLTEQPWDEMQFLAHLQMPVLLIQGTDDALVPLDYTRQLARRMPTAQILEYENSGHSPFLEQPERFNRDVLTFLSTHCESEQARVRSFGDAA